MPTGFAQTGPILLRRLAQQPQNLSKLLQDRHVLKVMHFAPFDLRFLAARLGIECRSVACTKAASKLLAPGESDHSLKALLKRTLDVDLDKGAVRTSDWSDEHLSEEQIAYATGDVKHLLALIDALLKRMEGTPMHTWYQQVCSYMPVAAHLEVAGYPDPLTY